MPLIGACCELSRCEPVEARVRAVGVVVDPPFFDDVSCLVEIGEQVLVEALVTQAAVEALYEAILHGFAGGNVVPSRPERCVRLPNTLSLDADTLLPCSPRPVAPFIVTNVIGDAPFPGKLGD